MRLSVSTARAHLGEVIMHVQNPNECAVICRYGKPVAGVVSIDSLRRIWEIADEQDLGKIPHPLRPGIHIMGSAVTTGKDRRRVTLREAALQLRTIQLRRREERRIIREGGLEVVEGGELEEERDVLVKPRRWWWF